MMACFYGTIIGYNIIVDKIGIVYKKELAPMPGWQGNNNCRACPTYKLLVAFNRE
tara:strand:+ start:105 stop:269 length:165 start_codon:yes stop_codon:yes gene_type:complete